MKKINLHLWSFFLFAILFTVFATAQSPCPKSGSATGQKGMQLNIGKNKSVNVSSSKTPISISLDSMLSTTKQDDKDWFNVGDYIITEGYLVNAIEEGGESCNCGNANATLKTGDVHMYLGLTKNAKTENCIIIEITPAFKKKHPDYGKYLTLKKKIRVTGYLLYDYIHRKDALMTCKKCSSIWRNNSWEIHPITKIETL